MCLLYYAGSDLKSHVFNLQDLLYCISKVSFMASCIHYVNIRSGYVMKSYIYCQCYSLIWRQCHPIIKSSLFLYHILSSCNINSAVKTVNNAFRGFNLHVMKSDAMYTPPAYIIFYSILLTSHKLQYIEYLYALFI